MRSAFGGEGFLSLAPPVFNEIVFKGGNEKILIAFALI